MRLENIPTQRKVVLLKSGKPMLKFIKGGIVIHSGRSGLKPCLIVEVDLPLTTKQKTDGFVNISLKEINTAEKFVPEWKNLQTLGADNTKYMELKKGTKLTVRYKYFIQPHHMIVTEDVKAPNNNGFFRILAQPRVFATDGPTREGASTEILTLSLDDLLDNPKFSKILTGRTGKGKKRKKAQTSGWRPPGGCTTGSHTNPNPKPNPKPNPLANPTSFYAYGYVHIK